MIEERRYLHRAKYVVPVSSEDHIPDIVSDGAVLTEEGVIKSVGTYSDLQDNDAVLVDHGKAVLMPAMVNCHSHLELSCYSGLSRTDHGYSGDMTVWIRELLAEREKPLEREERKMAAWQTLARMYAGGCRCVVDIGNLSESSGLGDNFKTDISFFLEILGLGLDNISKVQDLFKILTDSDQLAVHSPYSTHPEIIMMIKERATRLGHIMPIHVAESSGELELLATGKGAFRDFLGERGVWDGSFKVPGKSSVVYLDDLGVLDENTLCVHCVQVTDNDIEILAEKGCAVCVCPGSNQYLGVGEAPLDKFVDISLRVVLGTDSQASNPEISLWEEMRLLSGAFPEVGPLDIIEMATRNGAELFGMDESIGSLTTGCSSSFLSITGDIPDDTDGALKWLTTAGLAVETEWVE